MKTLIYQSFTGSVVPEYARVSAEKFKRYAKQIGSDYICDRFSFDIEKDIFFDYWFNQLTPIFNEKYHEYDRILLVDVDFYPTCDTLKNIFDEKIESVGMVLDFKNKYFHHQKEWDNDNIIEGNKEGYNLFLNRSFGKSLRRNSRGVLEYYNGGLILLTKKCIKNLYNNIKKEDVYSYIKDVYKLDLIINTHFAKPGFFLQYYFLKLGINITSLSDRWNYQRSDYKIYTNKSYSNPYFIHFRTSEKHLLTRKFVEKNIKNLYHDKLVIGCGDEPKPGWINSDYQSEKRRNYGKEIKKQGYFFSKIDVTEPLPFHNNDLKFIFSEHVLEHIKEEDGKFFLKEAYRTLRPGGVIRTVVPSREFIENLKDGDEYVKLYSEHMIGRELFAEIDFTKASIVTEFSLSEELCDHQWVPTLDMLIKQHEEAGFKVKVCKYFESEHPELQNLEVDARMRILESIVVEGTK